MLVDGVVSVAHPVCASVVFVVAVASAAGVLLARRAGLGVVEVVLVVVVFVPDGGDRDYTAVV